MGGLAFGVTRLVFSELSELSFRLESRQLISFFLFLSLFLSFPPSFLSFFFGKVSC